MAEDQVTEIRLPDGLLVVVVLKRSLDEKTTNKLVDDVHTAAAQHPRLPIVLDINQVRFAPSVALGAFVRLCKSFGLDRRRIALVGVHRRVLDAIRVTRLDKALEIHDTVEQVLQAPPP